MSENCADYGGKRVTKVDSSHFEEATDKMRLTLWGCQLNVGLNSEKFTPRETNAPQEQFKHRTWAFLNRFCPKFPEPFGPGAVLLFSEPLWRQLPGID
jgi:hypothetical protein